MFAPLIIALASPQPPDCDRGISITNVVAARVAQKDEAALGTGRVTTVQVTIDADGKVVNAKVYESSGLISADAAAITAARNSSYSPAMENCHPVTESAIFYEVVRPDYAHLGTSCRTSYAAATVIKQAQPVYPAAAAALKASGQAWVRVTIGPNGELENARIVHSAANMALDQAALDAASESIYAPKIVNCAPTTADYLFKVTFSAHP